MTIPREIRWGVLATGAISVTFTKDLLLDPQSRGVGSFKHTVVAAASSTSKTRCESFLKDVGAPSNAKAYGSYEELAQDPNVEIVYVATPHSHHYNNVMLCLRNGKHVLCEKAFTVNAMQARLLVEKAKEKGDVISSGRLGNIYRVFSDSSARLSPETSFGDGKHRMVNADLAGGALLDLGVYSLTWPFLVFWQSQSQKTTPKVFSTMTKYKSISADETTTMILTFPREASAGGDAHAIATTSMRIGNVPNDSHSPLPCVRIQGERGELQLFSEPQCPKSTRLVLCSGDIEEKRWKQPGPGKGSGWYNGFLDFRNPEGEGQGMFWEADDAALAIIEGRTEGSHMDLSETIAVMDVMDEVRRQNGLVYPGKVEATD
ncbi:oxidoreductase family protein [Colletotrichum costaricense]|uniref:D-xylose 1-dehydrogenase (NADP(+), D-xylono-1,5-lactone-forming) n=1 Tax=Colletotrichum costaricense TaxID=1209916 RepID=A0AAI9YIT8_9PEZI|nr:oxidoreductase family protein [Colletotrichum costaricense]KAK1511380.1 oxidoreductase family protein [Colletotrichum costaricense]